MSSRLIHVVAHDRISFPCKAEWKLYIEGLLCARHSASPHIIYRSILSFAIGVVGNCKLQKTINMKIYKHGCKEIQVVRDQILLEESEKVS